MACSHPVFPLNLLATTSHLVFFSPLSLYPSHCLWYYLYKSHYLWYYLYKRYIICYFFCWIYFGTLYHFPWIMICLPLLLILFSHHTERCRLVRQILINTTADTAVSTSRWHENKTHTHTFTCWLNCSCGSSSVSGDKVGWMYIVRRFNNLLRRMSSRDVGKPGKRADTCREMSAGKYKISVQCDLLLLLCYCCCLLCCK